MRHIAFLLALHFTVTCTQPAWQWMARLLAMECGATCTPDAAGCPSPAGGQDQSCCSPFQCCFPCCCFVEKLPGLSLHAFLFKNSRPFEKVTIPLTFYASEHFQPPETV